MKLLIVCRIGKPLMFKQEFEFLILLSVTIRGEFYTLAMLLGLRVQWEGLNDTAEM